MADWKQTLNVADIFHNDDLTFTERRDAVVKRLTVSSWAKANEQVQELVDELKDAQDVDEFDLVWSAIYDEADADRVWIKTRQHPLIIRE